MQRVPAAAGLRSSRRLVPADELVEPARPTVARRLLIHEGQATIVEGAEEMVPIDLVEIVAAVSELDAQHTRVVVRTGAFHGGRHATALLGPLADDVVVGRRVTA